jgi:hypothetical protein
MTAQALALVSVLAEGTQNAEREGINPILNGVAAFAILMLLLFITTRFNRDR